MRIILNKIFSRKLGIGRFIISGLAFLIGLVMVLIAVQTYVKVSTFLAPKNASSDYIILNKEVGIGNTLFGAKAIFSEADLEDIQKQEFAEKAGAFLSNQFEVKAFAGGDLGFYTEMFFESVPNEFIDNRPSDFNWTEGSTFLPVIVSQDFLNLYNFGYALGKGTPQVSASTIGMVPLKIAIEGKQGKITFDARVVGFSERIPSVLVPQNFLNWANKNIGEDKATEISRIIIKIKTGSSATMQQYLEEHNLHISDDKLKFSRITNMVTIAMSVLLGIGAAFILFALVIIIMNFTLIISDTKEEITLLIQLGYKTSYLVKHLLVYFAAFMAIISIVSGMLFYFINTKLENFFTTKGIVLNWSIEMPSIYTGLLFVAISSLVTLFSIRKAMRKKV